MSIPKILHQTWKSEMIPPPFEKYVNSWKSHHPMWLHILWTDEMSRSFVASYFPDLIDIYDSYETNIQRVDVARYLILYHYGGVYIDMDFECLRNIEPILEGETCVLGREPDEHCKVHRKELIISNAFMACAPRHHFLMELCKEIRSPQRKSYSKHSLVLESTGPFMLTRIYEQMPDKSLVRILSHEVLYPLTKDEIITYLPVTGTPQAMDDKLKNAYAIHYYWGTWWRKIKRKRVISILGIKLRIKY